MQPTEDPRTARSREAMLAAGRALLAEEGPGALTHQRVAQRAGVGRATVYRHWPSPELLVQAVFAGTELPFFADAGAGGGPLRPWLRDELRAIAGQLAVPAVAGFAAALLQGAQWDAAARAQRDELAAAVTGRLAKALGQAAGRGEVEAGADPAEVAAHLLGPLIYRALMQGGPVTDPLIDRLVEAAVRWTRTG